MAQRWTPQRMRTLRRTRIAVCALSIVLALIAMFFVGVRKTIALTVNGQTTTVTSYATSVPGLLREQHIDIKTHDLVQSTSNGDLRNHDVVTVKSAYQTMITIDGQEVPFWTVADSAEQLINFFEQNEVQASRVKVNIKNVYNKLTGGFIINAQGPVTVIADGKTSIAPNGKLPAASILDSKGIVLNKEDRVSVEKEQGKTILLVQRVTHSNTTETEEIPFTTRTVVNNSLAPGQTRIAQAGQKGTKEMQYSITSVDGKTESKTLVSQTVTKPAIDEVIEVGPDPTPEKTPEDSSADTKLDNLDTNDNHEEAKPSTKPSEEATEPQPEQQPTPTEQPTPTPQPSQTTKPQPTQPAQPSQPSQPAQPTQPSTPSTGGAANCRLYRPSPAAAQAYAAGAAAQYGWTGDNWQSLLKLWNRESGWLWYAENPSSKAYGIPQAFPPSKMAPYGDYRNDAAAQIDWGLNYIAGQYGSPNKAWEQSEKVGWY